MKRKLSPWCKEAKKAMIDKDMGVADLAYLIGKTREYTTAVLNGRAYAEPVVKEISDVLGIEKNIESL